MSKTTARAMPASGRLQQVTTVDGAVATFGLDPARAPNLPGHLTLRPQDLPFWDAILRARAIEEWGRIELVLAAQLARTQANIEEGNKLIDSGDRDRMEEGGFPSVRAVQTFIGVLLGQQLKLMSALRIIGTVVGDPLDPESPSTTANPLPRRKAEREAEQTIKKVRVVAEPELIASK